MDDMGLQQVAGWLSTAGSAVAFTGAGISTESGVPDFRSPGGIWSRTQPVYYDDFLASADSRHEYWRQKAVAQRDFANARPNDGHAVLAKWQKSGLLAAVITQNIDGLHQDAGSANVIELHGTARYVACLECEQRFDAASMVERFLADDQPPPCPSCGGIMKHATVSFGQQLPEAILDQAFRLSQESDLFLAMGSSLIVYPAAGLPTVAAQSGARVVIINRDATPADALADVVVNASIGETLLAIDRLL